MDIQTIVILVVSAFVLLYFARDIWIALDESRIRANIRYRDGRIKRYNVKKQSGKGGERFTIKSHTYHVEPDAVYRVGIFRVPTSYYNAEKSRPIFFQEKGEGSSTDYKDAAEHHVIEGLLRAFNPPKISPEMSLMLVALLIVGGIGYLWWDLSQELELIKEHLQLTNPATRSIN